MGVFGAPLRVGQVLRGLLTACGPHRKSPEVLGGATPGFKVWMDWGGRPLSLSSFTSYLWKSPHSKGQRLWRKMPLCRNWAPDLDSGWRGFVNPVWQIPSFIHLGSLVGDPFSGDVDTSNFSTHWNIVALLLDLEVDFGKCNFYAVQFGCVALDSISPSRQVLFGPLPSSAPEHEMPYL